MLYFFPAAACCCSKVHVLQLPCLLDEKSSGVGWAKLLLHLMGSHGDTVLDMAACAGGLECEAGMGWSSSLLDCAHSQATSYCTE